jgi:hypothetical protein
MLQGLVAVGIVLALGVLALLAWLITSNLAARREVAGQGAGIGLLQQQLNSSLAEFVCAWDTLGTHLRNAYAKYDDGQKRLDRLGLQLTQTQEETSPDETKTS